MAECDENSIEICRFRGDTKPVSRRITDPNASPTAIDLVGYTFLLTVNTEKDPDLSVSPILGQELFQIIGVIRSPGGLGIVDFPYDQSSPNPSQIVAPGGYFYDIEMIDVGGVVRTIAKGKYTIKQDITKN